MPTFMSNGINGMEVENHVNWCINVVEGNAMGIDGAVNFLERFMKEEIDAPEDVQYHYYSQVAEVLMDYYDLCDYEACRGNYTCGDVPMFPSYYATDILTLDFGPDKLNKQDFAETFLLKHFFRYVRLDKEYDSFYDIFAAAYKEMVNWQNYGSSLFNYEWCKEQIWSTNPDNSLLLMLCGDIESNPGPVYSTLGNSRNLDSRDCDLVDVPSKQSRKVRNTRKTNHSDCATNVDKLQKRMRQLVVKLAREAKIEANAQGGFWSAPQEIGAIGKDLNCNLERVCNFLEVSLPEMVSGVSKMTDGTNQTLDRFGETLLKTILFLCAIQMLVEMKAHKTALVLLLIVAARIFGFDKIIVDTLMELREAIITPRAQLSAEEVVYHPWMPICGKVIFLVMAMLCLKKLPGKTDVDNFMRRLDSLPKAVKGTIQMHDWMSKYFDLSLDHVKAMVVGKSYAELNKANSTNNEILEWAKRVSDFVTLEQRNKIDTDIEVANEAEKLWQTGLRYQSDTLLSKEMQQLVASTLRPARDIYQYVTQSPIKGGSRKMRPLMIWLTGQSGIGKTSVVDPLCIDLLRAMGLVGPTQYHTQVYGRQVETEYWDGYKSQKIVIYDDAFQMKDDKVNRNLEVFEVIRACNTYPQHLHMACLSDKNTFSAAEVYIYTTNNMNVKLESLTHEEAFFNRMKENAYQVRPAPGYRKEIKDGQTGKKRFLLDKTKTNGSAVDLNVYEFVKMTREDAHPFRWVPTGEVINYEKFAKLMCDQWRERKEEFQRSLAFLRSYAERPLANAQMGQECVRDAKWFEDDISRKLNEGQDMSDILYEYSADEELFADYDAYKKSLAVPCKWQKYADRIAIAIANAKQYAQTIAMKIAEVIKNHPYLSILATIGGVFALYHTMRWFSRSIEDNFKTELEEVTVENSKVVASEGMISDSDRTPKARRSDRMYVRARAEAISDETGYCLATNKVLKNTYRMSVHNDGKTSVIGNVTFLRGWLVLMPYHYVTGLMLRKTPEDATVSLSKPSLERVIEFPLSRIFGYADNEDGLELSKHSVRLEHEDGELVDAIVVDLNGTGAMVHCDLIDKVASVRDQLFLNTSFSAMLTTMSRQGTVAASQQVLKNVKPLNKPLRINVQEGGELVQYVQRQSYKYHAITTYGDCGAVLVAQNHAVQRKIFAMHIAGESETGYACPLTKEMLQRALEAQKTASSKITAQMKFEAPTGVNIVAEPEVPEGLFEPIGVAPTPVGMALKTAIVESCLYEAITPATTRPAQLNKSALLRGLKKCGVSTTIIRKDFISAATNDVMNNVLTQHRDHLDHDHFNRILTYEEAIEGVPFDEFMGAVKRTTSPGYPYCLEKAVAGKTKWLGSGQEYDYTSPSALKLREDVEQLIQDCREGLIRNVVFVDTLKDERREHAKVLAGKTRVFSAGPQHFVIAFRKYFLPFSAWIMHNRIDNEIAVGTNPHSWDWNDIAIRMMSKGDKIIAGDFGNFDGSLNAQILWGIFWDIFVPWLNQVCDITSDEGQDNLKVCAGLWTHIVHSVHIFGNNVYMWTHSQPSGNPFTVIINSLYNSIIMRVVWQYVMEEKQPKWRTMNHFNEYVSMISFGDDNLLNIADEVIDIFNQVTISEAMSKIGHEYTDETKSGEMVPCRKLEEVGFLKRGFKFDRLLQRWISPLKKSVIYEMLNWSRKGVNPTDITMSNLDVAFREIVYHGRKEYEELLAAIQKNVGLLPTRPRILTFEEYLWDTSLNQGMDLPYN